MVRATLAAAWVAAGQGCGRACSSKKNVKYSMHAYRKRSMSSVLQKDLNLFVTLCESAESTMAARTCRRGEHERGDGVGGGCGWQWLRGRGGAPLLRLRLSARDPLAIFARKNSCQSAVCNRLKSSAGGGTNHGTSNDDSAPKHAGMHMCATRHGKGHTRVRERACRPYGAASEAASAICSWVSSSSIAASKPPPPAAPAAPPPLAPAKKPRLTGE